jgi:tripartite-type tricarboxylate transporter receptor subunit TctC
MSFQLHFPVLRTIVSRPFVSWAARCLGVTAVFICLLAAASPARSEDWPVRPVTIIVPFPPGGNTDSMARILAQKLAEKFGRNFIVENRPGASGSIAMTDVTRATPDGYTLVFGAFQQISVLPYTETVKYDPKKDFSFISIFGEGPFVFAVDASVPATSVSAFVDYAKSKPGALTFASGGIFSGTHLVAALFFSRAGVNLVHVPFRGGAPAVEALLGGHVQAYFGNAAELLPLAQDPHVHILATSAQNRLPQLPDTPAMNELYPGFVLTSWNGLMASAKVPQDIRDKLEAASIEAAHDPQVIKTLGTLGITPVGSTSKEFADRIAKESALLNEAIAAARSSAQ